WSLGSLRKALRSTPGGLPAVSTYTLWRVLHGAGYGHQQTRSWCSTGTALRRRKAGVAAVTDPDAESKNLGWQSLSDQGFFKRPEITRGIVAEAAAERPHRLPLLQPAAEIAPGLHV